MFAARRSGAGAGAGHRRRTKVFSVLPTLLTLGNAVCGFAAITYAARWSGADPAASLFTAAGLIYLAMVFDALDGSAARWANKTSEFGAQLDSLCDAISFGVAPAFLMLQFALPHGYHPRLLWAIAAVYTLCTVLRLARFNVEAGEPESHNYFRGLPSPAAAGTVASFPLMVYGLKHLEYSDQALLWEGFTPWVETLAVGLLPLITLAVACLMVSRLRYFHAVRYMVHGRGNRRYVINLVLAAAVVFVLPQLSVPILFCWYAFLPPIRAAWHRGLGRRPEKRPDPAAAIVAPVHVKPAEPGPPEQTVEPNGPQT